MPNRVIHKVSKIFPFSETLLAFFFFDLTFIARVKFFTLHMRRQLQFS